MMCSVVWLLVACAVLKAAGARALDECTTTTTSGAMCDLHIDKLRPTQYGYGPTESSVEKHYGNGEDDWRAHMDRVVVPIVVGPDGFYVVDKHHRCLGLLKAHIPTKDKVTHCTVVANRYELGEEEFLKFLFDNNFVWSSDFKGLSLMDPWHLPVSFADMLPDPYRDLAGVARAEHAFSAPVLYLEFYWADFFREHMPYPRDPLDDALHEWCEVRPYDPECLPNHFDETEWVYESLDEALALANSAAAQNMPGFRG